MERLSTLIKSKSEENESLRQRMQDFDEFTRKAN